MSDTRDDDDREASRARRRRGLRVPVDDVPRPSFVEMNVARPDSRTEPASTPPSIRPAAPANAAAEVEFSLLDEEVAQEEDVAPRRASIPPPPPTMRRTSERPAAMPPAPSSVELAPEPKSIPPERTIATGSDISGGSIELSLDDSLDGEPEESQLDYSPRQTIESPAPDAPVLEEIVTASEPSTDDVTEAMAFLQGAELQGSADSVLETFDTEADAEPSDETPAAIEPEEAPSVSALDASEETEPAPEPEPLDALDSSEASSEPDAADLPGEPTQAVDEAPKRRLSSLPPSALPLGLFGGGDAPSTEQPLDDEPVLSLSAEHDLPSVIIDDSLEDETFTESPAALLAPIVAPSVVAIAPVVVVQRSVMVIGSHASSPPPESPDHTTPGGFQAPPALELSTPALVLDTDDPIAREAAELGDPMASGESDAMEMVDEILEEPAAPAPKPMRPPAPPPRVSNPTNPLPPIALAAQAAPPAPPAAAAPAAVPQQKKKVLWWEELFNDDYLRTVPVPPMRWVREQCDFIEQRLGLAKGAAILDVGCGLGLHAIELTRRGYVVVGLDFSIPMLSRAADEAQDQGFKINFLHADMREMNFDGAFDAVLIWGTTLGYFDDEVNKQVIERVHRALKPGGLFLIDVVNRDYAVRTQPNLVWFQGDGCIVMEETSFNHINSRLVVKRNVILDDGRQKETQYSIRLYALHELGQVLHQRGFRVVEVSGRECMPGVFFGADSPKMMIVAERRVVPGQSQPLPPAPSKPSEGEAS